MIVFLFNLNNTALFAPTVNGVDVDVLLVLDGSALLASDSHYGTVYLLSTAIPSKGVYTVKDQGIIELLS